MGWKDSFGGRRFGASQTFTIDLEYAIRRVQVNQDGLKLNVTHQLQTYADDVNIRGL